MEFKGKNVLVFGSGISGEAASRLLLREGASVLLYDGNDNLDRDELAERIGGGENQDLKIVLGNLSEGQAAEMLDGLSLAVLSPGVPVDLPLVEQMKEQGIPVWGEIELAYSVGKGDVLAITGTNGKTTTTSLLGEIMKNCRESTFVVGNIGNPYTSVAAETSEDSVIVAEMSSFQLETIHKFRPKVSAILNITPDHLNRHHTMENYVAVKESITKNQTGEDTCVLNYEDPYTRDFGERCPASVVWFSSARRLEEGYYLDGEDICRSVGGAEERLMNIHDMQLLGIHNVENVMAAIAMSSSYGVPMEHILNTVKHFKAVEHRIEYVATKKGVAYYNDSKGTNPDAAIQGIRAMNRPTILIGGGYDKQSEYDEWIEAFDGKVRLLVLIGQTKEKIAECARKHGFNNIVFADTFEECMDICVKNAVSGDAVLLSPACASWGMFPNYEVRGDMFKEYVNQLKE